jgi:F0F1-type ATP synthase assembly protein I
MNGDHNSDKFDNQKRIRKALISIAIQVGLLTLIVIFASLGGGLLLDQLFNTLPLFTILLLVISMPITWILVFLVVNRAKHKLNIGNSGSDYRPDQR